MSKPPEDRAFELVNGFRSTALVRLAAELRLPDLMAGGPASAADLSLRTEVLEDPLRRVLRALAALGVVEELADGKFALTEVGREFEDRPGSVRAAAITLPAEGEAAYRELRYTLETGRPGYEKAHGVGRWEHTAADPEVRMGFQRFMVATSEQVLPKLLGAFDFSGAGLIADVGGGHGGLLAGVLQANSAARGVLFDLPETVADAGVYLAGKGVASRCELMGGDFFQSVPQGADVYLLKFILHDWQDPECARILSRCREAMSGHATLLIVDRLLPDVARPEDLRSFMADLQMLVVIGGRERTQLEFEGLLGSAGLALERTAALGGGVSLLVARPAP